uniref:Tetratricopeptide repeat protein n=1 Tax=Trichuris muris TaxID=70415 RepID=A0A5S6Q5P5_TRIMR
MQDLPDKATEELRECLAKDTENPSVYLLLAEISLRQRNFDAAKSTLEAAVSYDFNVRHRPSYHLIRALIAVASHETKDANAILTNAIQLYSLKPSKEQSFLTYESLESTKLKIQLELAKLLQLDGNFEETEKILDALRQEYGEEHEGQIIFIQCDLLLKKKDVNRALRLLSEVSADKWYYVETRKIMADIYLTYKKDKRQYIACFKEMMHSSPTPEILIAAGDAYARILEMEKAIETYETALRKNPKDFALTRKIGQVYVRSHNYLKAVSYFEAALKRSGHDLIR